MSDSDASRLDLTEVLARFPHCAPLIRRLVVADESFWSVCEDYALARATLAKLQARPQDDQDAEKVAEYVALVADLEREITEALRRAG